MTAPSIMRAAVTASRWHAAQTRKGAAAEPYVNHLLQVAALVAEADAENIDLIVAALLHDAIEDQRITRHEIAAEFGEVVARLVEECTDDKALPKEMRKAIQVETAAAKSRDAKLLKLADKTSNLRAIATSPPVGWSIERRRAYVAWSQTVAGAGLLGHSQMLDLAFQEAVTQAEERLSVSPD